GHKYLSFFHFVFAFPLLLRYPFFSTKSLYFASLSCLCIITNLLFSILFSFTFYRSNIGARVMLKLDGGLNHYSSPPCPCRHLSLSLARRRSDNKPNAVVLVVVIRGVKLMRQKKMVFVGVTAENIGVQGE
ncbi:unnamed protein product, partial [Brassica rapa subsp. trilocularis]